MPPVPVGLGKSPGFGVTPPLTGGKFGLGTGPGRSLPKLVEAAAGIAIPPLVLRFLLRRLPPLKPGRPLGL